MTTRQHHDIIQIRTNSEQMLDCWEYLDLFPKKLSPFYTPRGGVDRKPVHRSAKKAAPPQKDLMLSLLRGLADPLAVTGVSFVGPRGVIDQTVFHLRQFGDEPAPTLGIMHDGDGMWLQSPAPIEKVLADMRGQLQAADLYPLDIDLELTVSAAWLFFASLDLLATGAAGSGNGRQGAPALLTLGELTDAMERPYNGLVSLAAYFRQELELNWCETRGGLELLVKWGVLERTPDGYLATQKLERIVDGLYPLHAHLQLRASHELPDRRIASVRLWSLHGQSGFGLLWYEVDGRVLILSANATQILAVAHNVLSRNNLPVDTGGESHQALSNGAQAGVNLPKRENRSKASVQQSTDDYSPRPKRLN